MMSSAAAEDSGHGRRRGFAHWQAACPVFEEAPSSPIVHKNVILRCGSGPVPGPRRRPATGGLGATSASAAGPGAGGRRGGS